MQKSRMITWEIPDNEALLAAVGAVALRHSQLDYALKLTIKSLANLELDEALAATEREGSASLRRQIHRLAKRRFGEGEAFLKLCAILEHCRQVSDRRNHLIHAVWGTELDGDHRVRNSDHTWDAVPTWEELKVLEEKLSWLRDSLTNARLAGFLHEAIQSTNKAKI